LIDLCVAVFGFHPADDDLRPPSVLEHHAGPREQPPVAVLAGTIELKPQHRGARSGVVTSAHGPDLHRQLGQHHVMVFGPTGEVHPQGVLLSREVADAGHLQTEAITAQRRLLHDEHE